MLAFQTGMDELPKQFVKLMRSLFDILDDKKQGFVYLADIESRWRDKNDGLPKGLVDSLRKVVSPSGELTFERLCTGLKLCLQQHRVKKIATNIKKIETTYSTHIPEPPNTSEPNNPHYRFRPASVPVFDHNDYKPPEPAVPRPSSSTDMSRRVRNRHSNTHSLASLRTMSMPHLKIDRPSPMGPKDNPIVLNHSESADNILRPAAHKPGNRRFIMNALEKWYHDKKLSLNKSQLKDRELKRNNLKNSCSSIPSMVTSPELETHNRSFETSSRNSMHKEDLIPPKKPQRKIREVRRHTLANGIDYNMLKFMKHLEQERDVLLQGLETVDRARSWYHKQLNEVQDKMKCMGNNSAFSMDKSADALQEKLNFQRAQILGVNQHLSSLMESSDKGFPQHMNLAIRQQALDHKYLHNSNQLMLQRLKDQNRLLSEEIGRKGDVISQLQQEKSTLIRELFQSRSQNTNDTTFM